MSGREDDATEVSWEDQQKINLFGRLSIRRDQLENKLSALKEQADNLEDASTDCELLEDHDRL